MLLALKGSASHQRAPQRPQRASENISAAQKHEHQSMNNSVNMKNSQHSTCCGHPIIPVVFHQPVSPAPFHKSCYGHSKLPRAPSKQDSSDRRKAPSSSPSPEPPKNCCLRHPCILAKHELILLGESCPKSGSGKGPRDPPAFGKPCLKAQSIHKAWTTEPCLGWLHPCTKYTNIITPAQSCIWKHQPVRTHPPGTGDPCKELLR